MGRPSRPSAEEELARPRESWRRKATTPGPASAGPSQPLSQAGAEYLSLRGLAAFSGISKRTLQKLLVHPQHALPHYRIGGKIWVQRVEFEKWMRRFRVERKPVDLDAMVDDAMRSLQSTKERGARRGAGARPTSKKRSK